MASCQASAGQSAAFTTSTASTHLGAPISHSPAPMASALSVTPAVRGRVICPARRLPASPLGPRDLCGRYLALHVVRTPLAGILFLPFRRTVRFQEEIEMKKLLLVLFLLVAQAAYADYPAPQEGTWVARDFRFHTGETL